MYIVLMRCDNVSPPCIKFKDMGNWYFTSGNCTGQMYQTSPQYWLFVLYHSSVGYYIFDTSVSRVVQSQLKSYYDKSNFGNNCMSYSSVDHSTWVYPIKQITFPFAGVDLAYPITVRQVQ